MKSYYIITFIKKILVILCGLVSASIAARYLGPELRGDYGVIIAWSSIWVVIFNFGLNYTYQSLAKTERGERQSLISSFVLLGAAAGAALIIMGAIIGLILGSNSLLFLSTVVGVFSLLRMHILFIALIEHFKAAAVISIVQSSIEVLLLLAIFSFLSPSVLIICLIFIAKEAVGIVSGLLILKPKIYFQNVVKSLPINFQGIKAQYFFTLINVVLLKMTLIIFSFTMDGSAIVGILAIAILISEYFWIISDISKDVLTKVTVDSREPSVIAKSLRITLFFCLGAFAVYLMFGKFFVYLLFGEEYIESYYQSLILILGAISLVSYKLISVWNISEGRIGSNNKVTFWMTMSCIPIMFYLAHFVGVWGVVWSSAFLYFLVGLFAGVQFSKSYSIPLKDIFVVRASDLRELKSNVL